MSFAEAHFQIIGKLVLTSIPLKTSRIFNMSTSSWRRVRERSSARSHSPRRHRFSAERRTWTSERSLTSADRTRGRRHSRSPSSPDRRSFGRRRGSSVRHSHSSQAQSLHQRSEHDIPVHVSSRCSFTPHHSHTPSRRRPVYEDLSTASEDDVDEDQSDIVWRDYDPDVTTHDSKTCDCSHCETIREDKEEEESVDKEQSSDKEPVSFKFHEELFPVLKRHLVEGKDFSCSKERATVWHHSSHRAPVLMDARWETLKDFHWKEL